MQPPCMRRGPYSLDMKLVLDSPYFLSLKKKKTACQNMPLPRVMYSPFILSIAAASADPNVTSLCTNLCRPPLYDMVA
ncbi:hypothetical protein BDDG_04312 [Blastomyces dermatitidis ATCC 18188]|uniref:Uncharacterized protein n=1 Tax=Ajellomyces dermatitidis (strain ATCC 18188 / CBS 674.68) TaxID=653446 RepID=F2TDQ7_AJEDA|nr:hypothetical protein BDDG_04312 [Blastomyces dermatitidis ATCC 18188]